MNECRNKGIESECGTRDADRIDRQRADDVELSDAPRAPGDLETSAGASFTPSPSIATVLPSPTICRYDSDLLFGKQFGANRIDLQLPSDLFGHRSMVSGQQHRLNGELTELLYRTIGPFRCLNVAGAPDRRPAVRHRRVGSVYVRRRLSRFAMMNAVAVYLPSGARRASIP